jgi:arylsulfatase A-like enzyme
MHNAPPSSEPRPSRRSFLFGAAAVPLIAQKRRSSPPNLLLIVASDLGAWMLGCEGNREILTPNIDRLARGGLRFTAGSVCTPRPASSRATLFTGRTPMQHGIHDSAANGNGVQNEVLLSDVLAGHGYRCGYAGWWDLGSEQAPQHHFESWYAAPEGAAAGLVTGHVNAFLDEQPPDKPFFLVAAYPNPREPYEGVPQKYHDLYRSAKFDTIHWEPAARTAARGREYLRDIVGSLRKCAAAVTALDDQIPPLLAKLEARGLRDNTLVLLTSDTGSLAGRHGLWGDGRASDPVNMYEEVMHVPLIWNWPGRAPVEATRPEVVGLYDVFPTLCEALDVPPPAGRNLCGRSFLPVVTGAGMPRKQPWHNLAFGYLRDTEMARDARYKLVIHNDGKGPNELYDLRIDPREKSNQYANLQFMSVRDRLNRALDSWKRGYSS